MTPPELNTGNSTVQTKVLNLLKACIECGVDGFCFDNAKHIELPSDDSSFASQFWSTVIGGAKDYASIQGFEEPFFYGEILDAASSDPNWKSTVVSEVNKFKNHFVGTGEYLSCSGSAA